MHYEAEEAAKEAIARVNGMKIVARWGWEVVGRRSGKKGCLSFRIFKTKYGIYAIYSFFFFCKINSLCFIIDSLTGFIIIFGAGWSMKDFEVGYRVGFGTGWF